MSTPAKSPRRVRYDEPFKAEAIRAWKTSHRPARVVAKEFGISAATLYLWGREVRANGGVVVSHLIWERDAEIGRLREEQGKLRQQCEILKKMLSIFVELPSHWTGLKSPVSRSARRRPAPPSPRSPETSEST
jgi:transposase-like protein